MSENRKSIKVNDSDCWDELFHYYASIKSDDPEDPSKTKDAAHINNIQKCAFDSISDADKFGKNIDFKANLSIGSMSLISDGESKVNFSWSNGKGNECPGTLKTAPVFDIYDTPQHAIDARHNEINNVESGVSTLRKFDGTYKSNNGYVASVTTNAGYKQSNWDKFWTGVGRFFSLGLSYDYYEYKFDLPSTVMVAPTKFTKMRQRYINSTVYPATAELIYKDAPNNKAILIPGSTMNIYASLLTGGHLCVYVALYYITLTATKDATEPNGHDASYNANTRAFNINDSSDYGIRGWVDITGAFTVKTDDNPSNGSLIINSIAEKDVKTVSETAKPDTAYTADTMSAYYDNLYKLSETVNGADYVTNHSIIGLPFSFISGTDVRSYAGINDDINDAQKHRYGSDYLENIIYDMPIAVIRPGMPQISGENSLLNVIKENAEALLGKAILNSKNTTGESNYDASEYFKSLFATIFSSSYERFYTFGSQYSKYIEYVNTLCHMFAMFLGIADREYIYSNGNAMTYGSYDDTVTSIDGDTTFTKQFGNTPAVYIYYQPDSNLNASFSTSTGESSVLSQIQEASQAKREASMIGTVLGTDLIESAVNSAGELASKIFGGGSSILGKGINIITAGANLSMPELWQDSSTNVEHEISIKLVSPYGDPESIFLYLLRPLARLIALALPHQVTQNSYNAPFIVQAFSKGQFNCQLGYITSLSITRGGEGAESHTMNHLPTELDVKMTISDMYEKVILSNEYNDNGGLFGVIKSMTSFKESLGLLFNNIGLMDFIASYSGYNLNQPSTDTQLSFMSQMIKNRINNNVSFAGGDLVFPSWERSLIDSYNNSINRYQTFLSS